MDNVVGKPSSMSIGSIAPPSSTRSRIAPRRDNTGSSYGEVHCTSRSARECQSTRQTPGLLSISGLNPKSVNFNNHSNANKLKSASDSERSPKWLNLQNSQVKSEHLYSCLQAIKNIEVELQILINGKLFLKKWKNYFDLRCKLQILFKRMLAKELKFCCRENVEQFFWKILYYNTIECIKKLQNNKCNEENEYDLKQKAFELIEDGLTFYCGLLKLLEKEYNLNLKYTLENAINNNRKSANKLEELAKVSAQKIIISSGDLLRYKEQIQKSCNYDEAREYYNNAQKLLPTNGIPYNQLAILALYSKKKFDAIYYHMRSLVASNPIHSAKESLKVLFDEIRKRYDSHLQELKATIDTKEQYNDIMPLRREVWTHPNGSRRLHKMSADAKPQICTVQKDMLLKLGPNELSKRFMLSFLNIHGKLFTGIGMENFSEMAMKMLIEFKTLISHTPSIYSYERLVQILCLNMFSIYFNNREDIRESKKEVKLQALNIASLMFGIILSEINNIIRNVTFDKTGDVMKILKLDEETKNKDVLNVNESSDHEESGIELPKEANILIIAIKVWCDLLMSFNRDCNINWYILDYGTLKQLNINPWKNFTQFLNLLSRKKRVKSTFDHEVENGSQRNILEEDIILNGFGPLNVINGKSSSHISSIYFCENKVNLRIERIFQYAQYLCDCDPPILRKICDQTGNIVYTEASFITSKEINDDDDSLLESNENFEELQDYSDEFQKELSLYESDLQEYEVQSLEEKAEVAKLIKRKNELEKKHKMQELYHQKFQRILQNSRISLYIEVRPKFLVPDTNCFIDSLDKLKIITISSEKFFLMVPLIVINELEGLSKGFKLTPRSHISLSETHLCANVNVANRSKAALDFVKAKNLNVKCVTTKGSILNSTMFTLEENENEQISNDDKILLTATALSKTNVEKRENGIHYIETEVVLLTSDRNLRVKALARNLPVSHLSGFLDWSGLPI